MSNIVNHVLSSMQRANMIGPLQALMSAMYSLRGKNVRSIRYLNDLRVWEFQIGDDFVYSAGPGWTVDYNYLFTMFRDHAGWDYLPQPGDVVIDAGAGIGEELMVFSRCTGPAGKVLAIEAHPVTFRALKHNSERNRFSNVVLVNKAIADEPGDVFIDDHDSSIGNKVSREAAPATFKAEAITIDELVLGQQLETIDFLKVNIEGAEQLLIKGMKKSIDRFRHMAISCHDFRYRAEGVEFFKTKGVVLEFLRDHGFNCKTRSTGNELLDDYVYASR